jgi:hypothetical protein
MADCSHLIIPSYGSYLYKQATLFFHAPAVRHPTSQRRRRRVFVVFWFLYKYDMCKTMLGHLLVHFHAQGQGVQPGEDVVPPAGQSVELLPQAVLGHPHDGDELAPFQLLRRVGVLGRVQVDVHPRLGLHTHSRDGVRLATWNYLTAATPVAVSDWLHGPTNRLSSNLSRVSIIRPALTRGLSLPAVILAVIN